MAIKWVDLDGLRIFKELQDGYNANKFALKSDIPTAKDPSNKDICIISDLNLEAYQKLDEAISNGVSSFYLKIGESSVPISVTRVSSTLIQIAAAAMNTQWDLNSDGSVDSNNLFLSASNITYSDLKALRDSSQLIPGMKYRIIDYVTSTAAENTQSAGHMFDIVVTALDESHLDEKASATHSVRDTAGYFSNADLGAWDIRYKLDPDPDTYEWTTANDTGVIYRMIDDKGNDCPYDFVNIMFKHEGSFYYTFNGIIQYDNLYYNNILGPNCWNIIIDVSVNCHDNLFGSNCTNIYISCNYCTNNIFGSECTNIYTSGTPSMNNNKIGDDCTNISFIEAGSVSFSNSSHGNIIGSKCENITLGGACNNIGYGSSNVSIDGSSNKVGEYGTEIVIKYNNNYVGFNTYDININGDSNKIGAKCEEIDLSYESGCFYNEIFNNNYYIKFLPIDGSTGKIQNIHVGPRVNQEINVPTDANYEVKVAKDTSGEVKIYCEADVNNIVGDINSILDEINGEVI